MHVLTRNKLLFATYMMTLMYAFHYGIPMYVISSYLAGYFGSAFVSVLYLIAGVLTIALSLHITKYLKHFHTYFFTSSIVITQILVTFALGYTDNLFFIGLFFIIHFVLAALIFTALNIFLESFTPHAEMGQVRGVFLTLYNLGFLISPFVGGALLSKLSYTAIFTVSASLLIPFLFFLRHYLNNIKDPEFISINLFSAWKKAWGNINIRGALISIIVLECFFNLMVIYLPLYIVTLNVPLTIYLTAILPLALIPLVIMPYEIGIIADTKLGEKEMLIGGLLLTALSTFIIAFIPTSNLLFWVFILILSRVGAALIETMAYTYYFKKINQEDVGLTNLFSNLRNIGLVFTTILGVVLAPSLIAYPTMMFIMIGLLLLWTVTQVLPIEDTL